MLRILLWPKTRKHTRKTPFSSQCDRQNQDFHLRANPALPSAPRNKRVPPISPLSPIWKQEAGSGGPRWRRRWQWRCFDSAFCANYYMKGGSVNTERRGGEKKHWIWVFLIHSARSNEISLVTAAHMHGIAWHRQIWQTLRQTTFDVCIHMGEEAAAHLLGVTKVLTFCRPEEKTSIFSVSVPWVFSPKSSAPWLTAPLFLFFFFFWSTRANFHFVICTFAVIYLFFLSLNLSALMKSSERKDKEDREHWKVCTGGVYVGVAEGAGVDLAKLFGPAVESHWLKQKDWLKNRRWHCWQNIPDRPDSRLISHPFFNVTPGLRTLEDYTQICQQEDHSGTASTWMGTQCTQKNDGCFLFVLPGRSVWENGGFGLEFREGDQKNSIFFWFSSFIISFHLFVTGPRHLHASEHCSILP